jgi:hypothetical protein
LRPREWASVVPLCAIAIVMGVFPTFFLAPMESSVRRVVERVQAVQPLRVDNKIQNSKFKIQTGSDLPQPSDVRRVAAPTVP